MPPKPKTHVNKRNHNHKNIANFKRCIKSINWNNVYYINNMILQFDFFMNNIINNFDKCFPIESTKINYKNRNPLINQNLKNEIKIRQIPTKKNTDNYKKYKNVNLSNQRKAERNYYREQLDLHKTDLKKSCNIIKNIISKEDNRHSEKHTCFLINNQYISDSK